MIELRLSELVYLKQKKSGNIQSVQEVVTPFYIVSYYIKQVTTSLTYSIIGSLNLFKRTKKCLPDVVSLAIYTKISLKLRIS